LPDSVDALRQLPGFGAYTAGAVASITFGVPTPAVDGNVRRVLSRLFDLASPTAAQLQSRAAELVDPIRPGDFNQALMELGATLCSPREPRCGGCPLETLCLARAHGTVARRPAARAKRAVPERSFAVAVVVDRARERVLLMRRPRKGLLAGLWACPEAELDEAGSPLDAALARAEELGLRCRAESPLPDVRHTFTHLRATYLPWLLRVEGRAAEHGPHQRWVLPCAPGVPLPTAQKRILETLAGRSMDGG
jgi:A/G-specific adenine glycosylase